jgi:hypothetical protein
MNIFSSRVQYVEFSASNYRLTTRQIPLPPELVLFTEYKATQALVVFANLTPSSSSLKTNGTAPRRHAKPDPDLFQLAPVEPPKPILGVLRISVPVLRDLDVLDVVEILVR